MNRVRAALLCATLVLLTLSFPAHAAPRRCGAGGDHDNAGQYWLALRPEFPKGPEVVTAIATPVFRPDTIYATNGVVVTKTTDAGCNWEVVLDATERILGVADSPLPSRIVALAAPSSATSSTQVYAAVERTAADGATQPYVLSSPDEGKTWATPPPGPNSLPPVGRIREFAVCNLMAKGAYVLLEVRSPSGATATSLYMTLDGGATWTRKTEPTASFPLGGIVVNPLVPANLYAAGVGEGVQFSENSGETFSEIGPAGDSVTSLSAAVGEGYVRVAVGHPGGNVAHVTDNDGKSWRAVQVPLSARFVSVAPLREALAVSDGTEVVVTSPTLSSPVFVTPAVDLFRDLRFGAPTQAGLVLMGIGDGKILRAVLDLATLQPRVVRTPVRLLPPVSANSFPPVMLPASAVVSLPAGATEDVPFTLLLPRTPSSIDVMFLIDSTGSMQPVIDGLKQSMAEIVNDLTALGLDVEFGVGDFRDVPAPHGKGPAQDMPYRRFRVIGPADEELQEAISQIQAAGGNGITAALIAAEQATAGKGYRAADGERIVDPGEDARFRRDTLRLAVMITDIGMAQGGNYPTMGHAAGLLREHKVRAVGIAVARAALEDQHDLAQRTGALTPEGGLDCNGDGRNDLAGNDPLVCDVSPRGTNTNVPGAIVGTGPPVHLAPAVVALTERAADYRPVRATLVGDADRASVVSGAFRPAVNLKADNELPLTVRFSCPKSPKRSRHTFTLNAGPGGTAGATATAVLSCGEVPPPPKRTVPPELIVAVPGAVPVGAAAAPGPPPPNPVPQPNINPNPNPNPGLNANVGMADQRQEDFQLALVQADENLQQHLREQQQQGETYAMSRRRESDPALLLGPTALLLASATWAARRRTAPRPALRTARARRW